MIELMIVVVLLIIVAAVAAPRLTRERSAGHAEAFARALGAELQRCRFRAIAEGGRLSVAQPGSADGGLDKVVAGYEIDLYEDHAETHIDDGSSHAGMSGKERSVQPELGVYIYRVGSTPPTQAPPTRELADGKWTRLCFGADGWVHRKTLGTYATSDAEETGRCGDIATPAYGRTHIYVADQLGHNQFRVSVSMASGVEFYPRWE
jgi:hypothetical protein